MRKALVAAVAATAIAAPAALAAKPTTLPAHPTHPSKAAPVVTYVFKGVVSGLTAPTATTPGSISLTGVSGNVFAKRVAGTAKTVTLTLDAKTVLRGTVVEPTGPRAAAYTDIVAAAAATATAPAVTGDTVLVVLRAPKTTKTGPAATLGAAKWLREMPAGSGQPAS